LSYYLTKQLLHVLDRTLEKKQKPSYLTQYDLYQQPRTTWSCFCSHLCWPDNQNPRNTNTLAIESLYFSKSK